MLRIAIDMLVGDRAKYLALVIGLSFGALLLTQQSSIFFGLLKRSTGQLQNIGQPDLWVADEETYYIGNVRPMDRDVLNRVRSTPGVEWAEPIFIARATAGLPDGTFKQISLIGLERSTLVGRPPMILEGDLDNLRLPDAVMVQDSARPDLGNPEIGDTLILNDRRAIVTGFCRVQSGLQSDAILYTTMENALSYVPTGRRTLSFVLVGVRDGTPIETVASRISDIRTIRAFTPAQFRAVSVEYIIRNTGIGVNFGITVLLGFIIGLVVSAAIFYQFVSDNDRHFATFKAMGATNGVLTKIIISQAVFAGLVGYSIGVGVAGALSYLGRRPGANLDIFFPWQLLLAAFIAMMVVVSLASLLSLRKVFRLQPASVFS